MKPTPEGLAPSSRHRQFRVGLVPGLLLVFLVALALRFGHLSSLQANWEGSHLFSLARADAAHHWREAGEILDEDPWLRDRVPWKGPGYSYFLAGLMKISGRSPGDLRWPLALLGALNCAGLVLCARRLLSPGWSVVAGLLAAVNGVLILFDGELLFPTLLIFLNLPVLLLLGRPALGRPGHALAGLLLGLSALVHPAYLLPALILASWIALRDRGKALILALALAAAVAPVTLTNVFLRGQPVLISWNGGINLYVGNQPNFDQYSGNRTSAWARIIQTPIDAGITEEHERDRLYYRLAWQQLRRAPLRGVLIVVQKVAIFFSPVEYANNIGLYELRDYSAVLRATLGRWGPVWWPFGLWGPAAILGYSLMLRRPTRSSVAFGLWSLGLIASVALSFNAARYRAPVVFFGSICVAWLLAAAWEAWRRRERKRLIQGVGLYLLLAAILAATAVPQRGHPLPVEWDEVSVLASAGSFEKAEAWARRARQKAPEDPLLDHALAGFYSSWGKRDLEREHLDRMLGKTDLEPDLIGLGHELLARSFLAEGRHAEARREIEAALALQLDDRSWRGFPNFNLGLGPVTACWLRLLAAEVEVSAGNLARAAGLIDRVRTDCNDAGRLRDKLVELEARRVLAVPRLLSPPR